MLKLNIYKKTYSNGYQALGRLRLDFPACGLFAIVGESGSGKSTLLNCLSGIDEFDGELIFGNQLIKSKTAIEKYRKYNVSTVFQDFKLLEGIDVKGNITLAGDIVGKQYRKDEIEKFLSVVGISTDYLNRKPNELSYGEMQRIAIARAIAKGSSVIVADEPTANLDSKNAENIMGIFSELAKEKLVILVTHNKPLAEEYCDGIVELKDGEIISNSIKEYIEDEGKENDIYTKRKRANFSLMKKIFSQQRKVFIKSIALTVITIIFVFFVSLGIMVANLDYESAAIRTLASKVEGDRTVYVGIRIDDRESFLIEEGMLGKHAAYEEVSINTLNTVEFIEYGKLVANDDLYYGNNLPLVSKIVYSDRIEGTGFRLIVGTENLKEGEIYLPSRIADMQLRMGHTVSVFVEQKEVHSYADLLGTTIKLNKNGLIKEWTVAGIFASSTDRICTYEEYNNKNPKDKANYDMAVNIVAINLPLVVSTSELTKAVDGIVLDYDDYKSGIFSYAEEYAAQFGNANISYEFTGSYGLKESVSSINSVKNYITIPLVVVLCGIIVLVTYISMATVIAQSKDKIVLLRALGMSFSELLAIFLTAMGLTALIQIATSLLLTFICVPLINISIAAVFSEYSYVLFAIDLVSILVPIAILLLSNIITALLHLLRLYKKSIDKTYKEV